MNSLKCLVLCISYFVVGSTASSIASFIVPCTPEDSKCMPESAKKVLPELIKRGGLDPMNINNVNADNGDLKLSFKNIIVTELRNTEFVSINRDYKAKTAKLILDIPITITGQYVMSGKLGPVEAFGDGDCSINIEKMRFNLDINMKTFDDEEGKEHYKIFSFDYKFEPLGKTELEFNNLYNGDKTKAEPVENLLKQNGKDMVTQLGGPVIEEAAKEIVKIINEFFAEVPSEQLEKV